MNKLKYKKELGSYLNPIIPGSNPDPSITRTSEGYFLITSSFDFFPGVPIYHSHDLIKWTLMSHVLTRRSQLDIRTVEVGGGVWAPTIRYRSESQEGNSPGEGGAFYVCGSTFDKYRPQADERIWPRGWYVKCPERQIWDPQGRGWTELVYFDIIGFDQDLFWDDDGTVYLSSTYRMHERTTVAEGERLLKDFAIHICTVDLATGRSRSRPQMIRCSSTGVSEGSHLIRRGGYYYLFTAEGGTEAGHTEVVCRSRMGPLGPWETGGILVQSGVCEDDVVQNTGHCDLVEDEQGRWWAVLLAVRPQRTEDNVWERSVFGRETFLIPVTWENDWPIFNDAKRIPLLGHGPGLYMLDHDPSWRDDFNEADAMQLGWYRKSTPQITDWSLTERPGYLRLWGGPYKLATPACSTMWLRKQTHREATFDTKLSFCPDSPRTEAGIVVWWNYTCFSSLGIRQNEGSSNSREVILRPSNGTQTVHALRSASSEIILTVRCGRQYDFSFREVELDCDSQYMGTISNQDMTRDPEVGAAFTGMMLGVYAYGDLEAALVPADFEYAQVEWNR